MRKDIKCIKDVFINGIPLIVSTVNNSISKINPEINTVYQEEKYQPKYKKPTRIKIDPYCKSPILPCRRLSMDEIFQEVVNDLSEEYQNKFKGIEHGPTRNKMKKVWMCYKSLPSKPLNKKEIRVVTIKYMSSLIRARLMLIASGLIIENSDGSFVKESLNDTEALEMIIDASDDLTKVDTTLYSKKNKSEITKEEIKEDKEEVFTMDDAEILAFVKRFDLFKQAFPQLGLVKFVELWLQEVNN
jgi:hypothetical protein